jgi:hypothetical protein
MATRMMVVAAGLALVAGLAAPVSAETILTPFVGTTFGGGGGDDFGDDTHLVVGGTLTFLGDGPLGFEIDGQYAPDYFGEFGDSNVTSLMGSFTLGGGDASTGLRFFVNGGAGLLKTHIADADEFFEVNRNAFGITFGGSVIAKLGGSLGVKGDVRYFRGLTDDEPDNEFDLDLTGFHFWRASAGLAIHF